MINAVHLEQALHLKPIHPEAVGKREGQELLQETAGPVLQLAELAVNPQVGATSRQSDSFLHSAQQVARLDATCVCDRWEARVARSCFKDAAGPALPVSHHT